jgi:hypothetical protein
MPYGIKKTSGYGKGGKKSSTKRATATVKAKKRAGSSLGKAKKMSY